MKTVIPRPVMRAVVRHILRPVLHPSVPLSRQRAVVERLGRLRILPRRVQLAAGALAGRPADVWTPASADADRAILHLHGGAFIVGAPRTYGAFAAHLAESTGCAVYVLDYRLAPEHPYPAAVDDAEAAFHELAERYDEVVVVGDSAGGGLALMLAKRLRDAGAAVPAALGLVSPLVDLTMSSLDVDRDDMLQRGWVESGAYAFAGERSPAELSPTIEDLRGLAPTVIHVGPDEMLRPDSEWLAKGMADVGGQVALQVVPRMWHVWHLHAGLFAEATAAVRELGTALSAEPRQH